MESLHDSELNAGRGREIVTSGTRLPLIDELFVDQRKDWFLILNPRGPSWCAGNKPVAVFAELCDGQRTVADIHALMAKLFRELTLQQTLEIAQGLVNSHIFTEGRRFEGTPFTNVTFNLTKRCNLSCPFCYYDSGPGVPKPPTGELGTEEWIDLGRRMHEVNPQITIYVAGGEPMGRSDCIDILSGLCALGCREVRLITNGTLFNERRIERISKIPGLVVQVSIDSVVEEENAKTRGPGSLQRALHTVERLVASGVDTRVSSTITKLTAGSLHKMRERAKELRAPFRTSAFFAGGERSKAIEGELGFTANEWWNLMRDELGRPAADGAPPEGLPKQSKNRLISGLQRAGCGVGWSTLSIGPDGTVSPCNHLTDPGMGLGNVRTDPLEEIVDRGRAQFGFIDVDRMPTEGCASCVVRYLCGGGCKASSYHAYGTLRTPPPDCTFLRRAHIEALWMELRGTECAAWNLDEEIAWDERLQLHPEIGRMRAELGRARDVGARPIPIEALTRTHPRRGETQNGSRTNRSREEEALAALEEGR